MMSTSSRWIRMRCSQMCWTSRVRSHRLQCIRIQRLTAMHMRSKYCIFCLWYLGVAADRFAVEHLLRIPLFHLAAYRSTSTSGLIASTLHIPCRTCLRRRLRRLCRLGQMFVKSKARIDETRVKLLRKKMEKFQMRERCSL